MFMLLRVTADRSLKLITKGMPQEILNNIILFPAFYPKHKLPYYTSKILNFLFEGGVPLFSNLAGIWHMWNKQPAEESRLQGFANFFFLLKCEATCWDVKNSDTWDTRSLFSFLALLMVFATVSGFTLIPVCSPSSKISFKNSFCQSLNGDLEDTTFKCRRPRNEWLNCLACYCRNPWSRNARTRRHSKCYKAKLIARLVLRQKGKVIGQYFN